MSYISDQILEATEKFVREAAEQLFDMYPLLESFYWKQGYNGNGSFFCAEEFEVNAGAYFGEDNLWRQDVCNQLRWAFDSLEPQNLFALYGKNVKVTVTRDETETTSLG